MIRTKLTAALAGLAFASSAQADFTFSSTDQGSIGNYRAFLIRAINDGIGTGTRLDGYGLTFNMNPGTTAHFNVFDTDFNGTPETADLINTSNPNAGFMRVGSYATTGIVATTPPLGPAQPNPWDEISTWSVDAISTGFVEATGNGAVIARLLVGGNGTPGGTFTGLIAGSEGAAVPVNYQFGFVDGSDYIPPTVTISPPVAMVDVEASNSFGPVYVTATDDTAVTSLTVGIIDPSILDNITITGTSPGPYEISGSGFGTDDFGIYDIDFTAMDAAGNIGMGTFFFEVGPLIPESATLSFLTGLSFLGLRRRNPIA